MYMMTKMGMSTPMRDQETGQFIGSEMAVGAFRMTPFLGLQLAPILNDYKFENPARIIADERGQEIARLKAAAVFAKSPEEAQQYVSQANAIEQQLVESGTLYDANAWFIMRRMGVGPYPYSPEGELRNIGREARMELDAKTAGIKKPGFPGWQYGGEEPEAEQMMRELDEGASD
jgi:hypothetical protein